MSTTWRVPDIRRVTGVSAMVVAVALLFEGARQFIDGSRPGLSDADGLVDYYERTARSARCSWCSPTPSS